ncbi:MAG: hypothetical protein ABSB65_05060 [Candidatus Acidiferrales bacterium]
MAFLFQTKNLLLAREFPTARDMEYDAARCIRYWWSGQAISASPLSGVLALQVLTPAARLWMAYMRHANGLLGPTVRIRASEDGPV